MLWRELKLQTEMSIRINTIARVSLPAGGMRLRESISAALIAQTAIRGFLARKKSAEDFVKTCTRSDNRSTKEVIPAGFETC